MRSPRSSVDQCILPPSRARLFCTASAAAPSHCVRMASLTSAPIAGECGRPRTVTRLIAPELGLDQWPYHDVRALCNGILRHEGEAEAGRDHGENPVVAVAAIHPFDLRAALGKNIARNVGLLAVDPIEVTLAVEIADANFGSVGQPVLATEHDEELLAEKRKIVKPLVDLVRPAIDGGLQSAVEQAALKVGSGRVRDLQLDAGMLRLQVGQ